MMFFLEKPQNYHLEPLKVLIIYPLPFTHVHNFGKPMYPYMTCILMYPIQHSLKLSKGGTLGIFCLPILILCDGQKSEIFECTVPQDGKDSVSINCNGANFDIF